MLLIVFAAPAQQLVVTTKSGTTNIPTSGVVQAGVTGASLNIADAAAAPRRSYIVELTEPSLLQRPAQRRSAAAVTASQSGVRQRIATTAPEAAVTRSFTLLFNAVAVQADADDAERIAALDGVKRVYDDMTVTGSPAAVTAAAPPQSTAVSAASGKGVRIGVIDSGIDYAHEAFGGGFGAGYAVAGGYDFVNNDADPMDDNGHGTHVAGIIAGRSPELQSAGRGAELFAYKVLDARGSGGAAAVIAAIERAVADSVDIINMSLGSPSADPNDVLCEAVNRAVRAGILVVTAAGNAGEFESVTSPGIAAEALTVGASEGRSVASFSSKGPVSLTYAIKPDVVAPGSAVRSAKNGGGYTVMSGTSMAAPYVTAAAALLKELHPEWSAAELKHAILSRAQDLKLPLFAQGNGLVEMSDAIRAEIIAEPSGLSFGFDDPSAGTWSASDTVTLVNRTAEPRTYAFAAVTGNPAVSLTAVPAAATVPANGSVRIAVTLTVNNLYLPNGRSFADGTSGTLLGTGAGDSVRIPFTFFKGNVLQLQFSTVPWQVLVHNGGTYAATFVPKGRISTLVVNEGTYDAVTAFFGGSYVVKEGLRVSGRTPVSVERKEARHRISMAPVDEAGAPFGPAEKGNFSYIEGIVHKATGHAYVGMGGGMMTAFQPPVKFVSDMSGRYQFAFAFNLQRGTARTYTFDVSLDSGIAASRAFTYRADDLKKVEMKYSLTAPNEKVFPLAWSSFVSAHAYVSVTFYDGTDAPLAFPYIQSAYYSNRPSASPIFHHREAYRY